MTPTPSEARQVALPELTPELLRRCGMAAAKVMLTGCEDGAPLRAALEAYREEAIRALRQGGEAWQPIATAPKDAYEIILGSADSGVTVGFWHDGSECYGHRGGAGWFSSDDRGSLLTASNFYATHWQPLPPPPAEGEAA